MKHYPWWILWVLGAAVIAFGADLEGMAKRAFWSLIVGVNLIGVGWYLDGKQDGKREKEDTHA